MLSCSEVLSTTMLHTQFFTPICVFHADFALEFIYHLLRGLLAGHGTFAQYFCHGPDAQNVGVERKHCHLLKEARALKIIASLPPHFWVEFVSTSTYLMNIQPCSHGDIHLERTSDCSLDYSLFVFLVVLAMLSPRDSTKLAARSVQCIFLIFEQSSSDEPSPLTIICPSISNAIPLAQPTYGFRLLVAMGTLMSFFSRRLLIKTSCSSRTTTCN